MDVVIYIEAKPYYSGDGKALVKVTCQEASGDKKDGEYDMKPIDMKGNNFLKKVQGTNDMEKAYTLTDRTDAVSFDLEKALELTKRINRSATVEVSSSDKDALRIKVCELVSLAVKMKLQF